MQFHCAACSLSARCLTHPCRPVGQQGNSRGSGVSVVCQRATQPSDALVFRPEKPENQLRESAHQLCADNGNILASGNGARALQAAGEEHKVVLAARAHTPAVHDACGCGRRARESNAHRGVSTIRLCSIGCPKH
jgi:hypothetical protein